MKLAFVGTWNNLPQSAVSEIMRYTLALLLGCICFAVAQSPTSPQDTADTGIEGVILIGPTHPGPVRPGIASTSPLANAAFVVSNETGAVSEFTTDDQGHFKILLAPGHYTVMKKGAQTRVGRYGPFDAEVAAGQITRVEWQCDTGMR